MSCWTTYADFDAHYLDVRLNPEWLRLGPEADIAFVTSDTYREINVGPPPAIIVN